MNWKNTALRAGVTPASLTEALKVLVDGREKWSKHVLNTGDCWCGEQIANSVGPEQFLKDHLPCADKRSEQEAWPEGLDPTDAQPTPTKGTP